jgi:OOP family OmpA-OmpF porin
MPDEDPSAASAPRTPGGDLKPLGVTSSPCDGKSASGSGEPGASIPLPPPPDSELSLLRGLLVQREIALLEQIRKRLDDPVEHARDISTVIAEALIMRAGRDDMLNKALGPAVETNFKAFLRRRPQDVISTFFPLIGATIRRSIAESFRSMLEGFNKGIEHSLSVKGLHWRLEALRTGKPFSEIVLLHTLLYRVEQIFFIHGDTGLVLAHAVGEGADSQDADMVSAMLTAIQDFVRDCFAGGGEEHLESLRLGDFTVMVERAPSAYLACVVRGTPPEGFRERIRSTLEVMLVECDEALNEFNGDNSPFQGVQRHLLDCLVSESAEKDAPLPLWLRCAPALLLLALLGAAGWYAYAGHAAEQEIAARRQHEEQKIAARRQYMERGIEAIRNRPGYTLLEVHGDPGFGIWRVFCLRDELAAPPRDVLQAAGVNPDDYDVRSTPYFSYQPELIERRVTEKIAPPPTVGIALMEDGVLRMEGSAPMGWILQARQTALGQPGIKAVDIRGLKDPRNERLTGLITAVESISILFPLGKALPEPEEMPKLADAGDKLVELEKLAGEMGMAVALTIYGHADAVGNDKRNYEISQERAKTLAAVLYSRGSAIPVSLYGMGADYADKSKTSGGGDRASRKIELRVHLNRAPDADLDILRGLYR